MTLTYPEALELARDAKESARGIDGGVPASITVDACTGASAEQLADWFNRSLAATGWARDPATQDVDTGLFTIRYGWIRNGRRFDLFIDTPANLARRVRSSDAEHPCTLGYRTIAQ